MNSAMMDYNKFNTEGNYNFESMLKNLPNIEKILKTLGKYEYKLLQKWTDNNFTFSKFKDHELYYRIGVYFECLTILNVYLMQNEMEMLLDFYLQLLQPIESPSDIIATLSGE